MKEKAMETQNNLTVATDLTALVKNTNAIIEIDVKSAIEYIDHQVQTFTGESEELEANLKKWFKDLAARRLDLTRPVNESLKQVIADEKKISEYLDQIFAANQANRDAAEAERKKAKHAEVLAIMAEMLNAVELPPEYLSKVVFREEYYQKTMVNKKLKDSIQAQIDDQVKLYAGWKAEQELKQQKIKNRELLIEKLNAEYGFSCKYSNFPIETYSDEQVESAYKSKKEKQDAQKAQEQAATEAQKSNAESGAAKKYSVIGEHKPSHIKQNDLQESQTSSEAIQMDAGKAEPFSKTMTITITTTTEKNIAIAITALEKMVADTAAQWNGKVKLDCACN